MPHDDLLWQSYHLILLDKVYWDQVIFVSDCQYSKSSYAKFGSAFACQ